MRLIDADALMELFKTVLDAIKAVKSEVDGIKRELSEIRDDADRRDALQARTHILRFRDELQNDMTHTSEYFDQILEESQHYEQYCEKNPDFPNGRTEAAIKYITEEHQYLQIKAAKKMCSVKPDASIKRHDLIVRTRFHGCRCKGHKVKDVTAIIECLNVYGYIIRTTVPAAYCDRCGKYYILQEEYEKILKFGYPLCVDESTRNEFRFGGFGEFDYLKMESVMHKFGYNVSKEDHLDDKQRRNILMMLIETEVLTKVEICSHLDWLISSRSNYQDKDYSEAISCWSRDRGYIAKYRMGDYEKIFAQRVIRR